jgi:hypothetical protein
VGAGRAWFSKVAERGERDINGVRGFCKGT